MSVWLLEVRLHERRDGWRGGWMDRERSLRSRGKGRSGSGRVENLSAPVLIHDPSLTQALL